MNSTTGNISITVKKMPSSTILFIAYPLPNLLGQYESRPPLAQGLAALLDMVQLDGSGSLHMLGQLIQIHLRIIHDEVFLVIQQDVKGVSLYAVILNVIKLIAHSPHGPYEDGVALEVDLVPDDIAEAVGDQKSQGKQHVIELKVQ